MPTHEQAAPESENSNRATKMPVKNKKQQEETEQNPASRSNLPEPIRLHERNDEDEMEDLYREEENRGTVEAA